MHRPFALALLQRHAEIVLPSEARHSASETRPRIGVAPMKKTLLLAGITSLCASAAYAQSNVTLYGLFDAGVTYPSNDQRQSGANVRATGNQTSGSRFGLSGAEDLGGGIKAIFKLESGFDPFNGTADNGRLFNRQGGAGISGPAWGAVTLGRQYDSSVDYLSPLSLSNIDAK